MKYSIENFENSLLNSGLTMTDLEKIQQYVRDWYYDTEDLTLEELVEDFLEWLVSNNILTKIKNFQCITI